MRRPSVRSPPKRRLTCPRVSDSSSTLSQGSPDPRLRPFGPGHAARYPASYPGRPAEGPAIASWFPTAFRPPALACRVILFPPGSWAFLTVGLPGTRARTRTGFPRSAPSRYDRSGCLLDPGDGGALLARCRARPAPAASQRPVPVTPQPAPIAGVRNYGASTEVHAIHPPGLPLACGPRMGQGPLGFPLCSAPRRYQRRTTGRGPA
jgi:hypothetical protein